MGEYTITVFKWEPHILYRDRETYLWWFLHLSAENRLSQIWNLWESVQTSSDIVHSLQQENTRLRQHITYSCNMQHRYSGLKAPMVVCGKKVVLALSTRAHTIASRRGRYGALNKKEHNGSIEVMVLASKNLKQLLSYKWIGQFFFDGGVNIIPKKVTGSHNPPYRGLTE